jgi:molybdenum cofactor cytidylyltransferase
MIAGLILAAGESSRMGNDKALLRYRDGTFLETIVAALREAEIERIAIVLGHHADEIRRAVNLQNAEVVFNADYARGQTSSLQAGLRSLRTPELEAVILCLVDHPAVSSSTVHKLVEHFRASSSPVVIPTFQGRRGHPVLIARALFDELLGLGSNEGANTVLRKHRNEKSLVEVGDSGILLDIDTAEAYLGLQK